MAPPDLPDDRSEADARPAGSRTLVFTAMGAVLAVALIVAIVSRAGSTSGARSARLNRTPEFDVGPSGQLAPRVDRSGPLLFQDLLGRSRDIYVQHLGGADWAAFEAHALGSPRRCVLMWAQDSRQFVDPCDRRTYPADGAGLTTFPTRVDGRGHVVVDLGSAAPPAASTTTAPAAYPVS